jgi:agmatine deiminase
MSPLATRYVMPPEWTPHEATWFSWPHNRETWPGCFEEAQAELVEGVAALAQTEPVHINVLDDQHAHHVRSVLGHRVPERNLSLEHIPTNDAWCRDHGAIIVRDRDGRRVALDFRFNAWGEKYLPYDLDDAVPPRMAKALGIDCVSIDMVLEGGSIEVNGAGVLLTTEECLLNPNRNPRLSRGDIEAALARYLGARQVVWLGKGIAGDDTDGHVDDLTRFVSEDTVVTVVEPDTGDINHAALRDNHRRLSEVRLPDGRALRVIELPMPEPVVRDGERLPASYANFYIGNEVVLLPVFGGPRDRAAIDILARLFPQRRVVPVGSRALVGGFGSFHCLTQQVPAAIPTR